MSFFRRGHESINSPGDVHFLIHPKIDRNTIGVPSDYRVMTVNYYDILIQVPKGTSDIIVKFHYLIL